MEKPRYEGLWNQRQAWYSSRAFNKKDLLELLQGRGEKVKLIVRYNKFYEKDSNKPKFIFAFADTDAADFVTVPRRFIDDGTEYISVDDAIDYARGGAQSIKSGYDGYDVYCAGDLVGKTITELLDGE